MTLLGKVEVAHGQDLIYHQYVRLDLGGDGKAQPGNHARGKAANRGVEEVPQLGKVHDPVEVLLHLPAVVAQQRAIEKDVFPGSQVHIEARPQLDQRRDGTVHRHVALGGVHHPGNQLEHGALAAAVHADQRHGFAPLNGKIDVVQGPELGIAQPALHQLDEEFLERIRLFILLAEAHGHVPDIYDRTHVPAPERQM